MALERVRKFFNELCFRAEGVSQFGTSRYRQALRSSVGLVLERAMTFASMLVLVPLLLGYLENERFGLWMTFSSITALMSFADFGLGNGLMTTIAAMSAHDSGDRL